MKAVLSACGVRAAVAASRVDEVAPSLPVFGKVDPTHALSSSPGGHAFPSVDVPTGVGVGVAQRCFHYSVEPMSERESVQYRKEKLRLLRYY